MFVVFRLPVDGQDIYGEQQVKVVLLLRFRGETIPEPPAAAGFRTGGESLPR
jgi:hypothetical protein